MSTQKINLTMSMIDKIVPPQKGRAYYYDTKERGLVLDVTAGGVKTFYLYRKVNGTPTRVRLGDVYEMNITEARNAAQETWVKLKKGKNPTHEKRKFRQESTLKELFNEYMERYSKKQKKSWKYDEREIPKFLDCWFNRKISDITKVQIQKLHEKIRDENGLYQANRLLERLKSMYNRAIEWGWDGSNPCKGIKKFKEVKRDRFLLPDEFPAFFKALEAEENISAKNYIWMSLFTGARKSNVLAMRWDEIDFDLQMWRIPDTKNGEPLNVPLIGPAMELLSSIERTGEWVFPSEVNPSIHLQDPKKAWARILTRAGIENLRIHDIRRTLGSYQAITGASLPIIGRSLGHKSQAATAVYARLMDATARESMEKATAKMLEYNK